MQQEEQHMYPDVLYIEDTPEDAEMALHILKKYHLATHIRVLEDGQEAIEYIFGIRIQTQSSNLPKLILLDLKLPKVGGLEILRRIKTHEMWKQVPVVIFTSSNQPSDIEKAYTFGANGYVVKPVDFHAFADVLRQTATYWLLFNQPFVMAHSQEAMRGEHRLIRILILEDTPEDAELMMWELEKNGLQVDSMVVDDEEEFCRSLQDFQPDIILSDYVLPTFSGFDAFGMAQKMSPHVPFIFVTSAIGKALATETILGGASGFILKSELHKLPPLIREALQRKPPPPPQKIHQTMKNVNEQIQANAAALEKLKDFLRNQKE